MLLHRLGIIIISNNESKTYYFRTQAKNCLVMRKYIILIILVSFVVSVSFSCSNSRDVSERRSLMMPKKSEVPRNAGKYKERERKYSH